MVFEDFGTTFSTHWRSHTKGTGILDLTGHSMRFINQNTRSKAYTNVQIDDYQGLSRRDFPWRPPLTLTVRARFSHSSGELSGTAGFGFWNDPFMMTGRRTLTLPRAIWFFYASAPSNMHLDLHTPGHGWKAATIDALRWSFFLLLPTAPLALLMMNIRPLYRALWPIGQAAIGVSEAPVGAEMTEWHTYVIAWSRGKARFAVDDVLVLDCSTSPRDPLGFVMWFDNQYAVVTPWGRFGHGLLGASGCQWMEIDTLSIEPDVLRHF